MPKITKLLTEKDRAIRSRYRRTAPKPMGNLHERMQHVMSLLHAAQPKKVGEKAEISDALHAAIWDLQTEVSFYAPVAGPPYGQRPGPVD